MNEKIAKIFYEMAGLLEMEKVPFKPAAYEKAARSLESLDEDVRGLYAKEGFSGLLKIPGVGKGIAERIEEYIKTGKIKDYEKMKKKFPVNVSELIAIEGIGPKLVKLFYEKLKIRDLKDLERAVKAGKLAKLPRSGEKLQQKILKGIEFHKKSGGRLLLGNVYPLAEKIKSRLLNALCEVEIAGSFRRAKETIGDLDILLTYDVNRSGEKLKDYFVKMPEVEYVYAKGPTKVMVRLKNGLDADLRIVPPESFGAALQYFTGNKAHNIKLRKIAAEKGYKLNEYGLYKISNLKYVAGRTEEEIYEKLGLQWIPPEAREDNGEIELAQANKIPKLVEEKDIRGDTHCHRHFDVIKKAQELGYEYVGISDHTKFLAIEHGLNERQLLEQKKEIEKLNKRFKILDFRFKILHGCEANIIADGSIDISDEVLAQLDYVIAGIHSRLNMPKKEMTERIIAAMRNPHVDIIAHLTGRIIQRRDEYGLDFDKILEVAKETGTILEINANPTRLDLRDENIRKAKEAGVKMIIGSDAHQPAQMDFMKFGITQARRGWLMKEDVINTLSLPKLLKLFRKEKNKRFKKS